MAGSSALFIAVGSVRDIATELAVLSPLAAMARSAGLSSRLLIVAPGSNRIAIPSSFDQVDAVVLPEGSGDGVGVLDAIVSGEPGDLRPAVVVAVSTLASRSWAARLAARLQADYLPACDAADLDAGHLRFTSPVMGGVVRKSVAATGARPVVVLYAGDPLPGAGPLTEADVVARSASAPAGPTFIRSEPLPDTGGIPLRGAARIVSGGLGIGGAEAWKELEAFAAAVGAAVGASRAAVEMGWAPSSRQVGFSGQKVAPEVYVAVGISGAVHHLAGIGAARKIVAINKDPDAHIFKIADVPILGDWRDIVSAAMRRIQK